MRLHRIIKNWWNRDKVALSKKEYQYNLLKKTLKTAEFEIDSLKEFKHKKNRSWWRQIQEPKELVRSYLSYCFTPLAFDKDLPLGGDKYDQLIALNSNQIPAMEHSYSSTVIMKVAPRNQWEDIFKKYFEPNKYPEFDVEFKNGFLNFTFKDDYLQKRLAVLNHLS